MSRQHFVRNLLELNAKCPRDHMKHFHSVRSGKVRKIMYYNRSFIMIVTMEGREQVGVKISVRAPHHDLAAEQGLIERSLGVEPSSPYKRA